jgi:hypothetical protein
VATAKSTTTRTRTPTTGTKPRTKAAAAKTTTPDVVDVNRVSKPLYAYVGIADLAVEKLRTLPEAYAQSVSSTQAQVRGSVKTLPIVVRGQLTALPNKAKDTYADLVERGHQLISTLQNNPGAKAALKQAKTARAQAKGATTSAFRSVKSAEKGLADVEVG